MLIFLTATPEMPNFTTGREMHFPSLRNNQLWFFDKSRAFRQCIMETLASFSRMASMMHWPRNLSKKVNYLAVYVFRTTL